MAKYLQISRLRLVKECSVPYGSDTYANDPRAAIEAAREYISDFAQETVLALYRSAKGKVLCGTIISVGTIDQAQFVPRDVIAPALLCGAAQVILLHNHPSGDPTPSAADYAVTARLKEACDIMGLALSDHIVVGTGGQYFSFYEQKCL